MIVKIFAGFFTSVIVVEKEEEVVVDEEEELIFGLVKEKDAVEDEELDKVED